MIRIEVTFPLSGRSFIFTNENITNFSSVYSAISVGGNCLATLEYGGDTYNGKASIVGQDILVTFDTTVIVPSGTCIDIECTEEKEERDCKDVQVNFSEDLRIAVLDEKGCLKGWIRLGDILQKIKDDSPNTLCELYGYSAVPQGHLTASDRILTVDGSCGIKSIPASDIVC